MNYRPNAVKNETARYKFHASEAFFWMYLLQKWYMNSKFYKF